MTIVAQWQSNGGSIPSNCFFHVFPLFSPVKKTDFNYLLLVV